MDRLRRSDVFGPDGFPACAARVSVADSVAVHSHDFLEIALVVGGHADHVGRDGRTPLRPGQVLAVRPGQWHGYEASRGLDVFNLYVGPELVRRELVWTLDHPDLARFLLRGGRSRAGLDPAAGAALIGWLSALAELSPRVGTPAAVVALGLLCCALGEIATTELVSGPGRSRISPPVRDALHLMGDDPAAPWRMADLAARLNVSASHLHRLFTTELGTAPMAWLARSRVELAASLLISTTRPVAEIGRLVGWPDPNYFSRRFSALTGNSPTDYRRRFAGGITYPGEPERVTSSASAPRR